MCPVEYLDAVVSRLESVTNMVFDEPFVRWDVLARLDSDAARLSHLVADDDRTEIDSVVTRLEVLLGLLDLLRERWRDVEGDELALRRAAAGLLSLHGLDLAPAVPVDIDTYVPPFAAGHAAAYLAWQQSALRGERPSLSAQLARTDCDEWERRSLEVQWRGDEQTTTVVVTNWGEALTGDGPSTMALAALLARYGTLSPTGRPDVACADVPVVAARWAALAGQVSGRWTAVVIPGLDADGRARLFSVLCERHGVGWIEGTHHLMFANLAERAPKISVTGD